MTERRLESAANLPSPQKQLVLGILAGVDAGKTTLSEGLLFLSGKIKRPGRVDKGDVFLDIHALERERGITIFSKQAVFEFQDRLISLLDTPGHADFSAEMERTLHVLDYAVLVISGADGVQAYTKTLWRLLKMHRLPVFIFVNKMDLPGTKRGALCSELKKELDQGCLDFQLRDREHFFEELAVHDESLMESYLNDGQITDEQIKEAIAERRIFPCYFGSALKLDGVEQFLQGIQRYTAAPFYPQEFGAKIYKVSRDEQGTRLTHLKVVGGRLSVKDELKGEGWTDKVHQIRIYSGEKFSSVAQVQSGSICAVTGLSRAKPGEGLGVGTPARDGVLEPVLSYSISLPAGCSPLEVLPLLREIEEEQPELRLVWNEMLEEIQVQLMGEVQVEILRSLIESRFGISVSFDAGQVLYKETIQDAVEGVGHFEPLHHYAEVHLLLEPGARSSGLQFVSNCSEERLSKNWQRLILTHLREKTHRGVLTGSPITDLKITLVNGRAHKAHTQGGDFRQATYRAVRQGLSSARSILLEPYYFFRLEVPSKMVGKALTDLEKMHAAYEIMETTGEIAVLEGSSPVVNMRHYQREVTAYTQGMGRLFLSFDGYWPCHNAAEVTKSIGYDPEKDLENPAGSVFFRQGSGFYVPWHQVKKYMHLESSFPEPEQSRGETSPSLPRPAELSPDPGEIDYELLLRTGSGNRGKKRKWVRKTSGERLLRPTAAWEKPAERREEYLLVDGYNIIHAWPELKKYAQGSIDVARTKLLNALASYGGMKKIRIMVVFDAYRLAAVKPRVYKYHNICVVFTKEAQSADHFIEQFAYEHRRSYQIKVATSDGLEQIILRGAGSTVLSPRELKEELDRTKQAAERSVVKHQENASLSEAIALEITEEISRLKKDRE